WLMMSLWDALRMNMMISYQELVRTFLNDEPDVHAKIPGRIQRQNSGTDVTDQPRLDVFISETDYGLPGL
ncbi:hypothetical protein V6086_25080, partial [Klebsiella pneumoniae]